MTAKKKPTQKIKLDSEPELENDLVVKMEPKKTYETTIEIKEVKKAEPPILSTGEHVVVTDNQVDVIRSLKMQPKIKIIEMVECQHCHNIQEKNLKAQDPTTAWCAKCGKAFLVEWKKIRVSILRK
jgi:hypothetical protein